MIRCFLFLTLPVHGDEKDLVADRGEETAQKVGIICIKAPGKQKRHKGCEFDKLAVIEPAKTLRQTT
jgi:hypothetical protein